MNIKTKNILSISAVAFLAFFITACSKTLEENSGDVLVSLGNSQLTKEELIKQLPSGLTAEDSTKISRAYIRSWIDSHLISEIAAHNIGDLSEIDRLTEQYRNDLIAYEYRRRMYDEHAKKDIAEDSIKKFYENNQSQLTLQRPIIKGVYLKIPDQSPALKNAKKWYCSENTQDIDKLEKQCLDGAIHYDYFKDRWIDWEKVETQIPEDFGSDINSWLSGHKKIELSQGGFTYLLYISEYIPSGKIMPYEYAKEGIKEILIYQKRADYDRQLRLDLLKQAEEDGKITINCVME